MHYITSFDRFKLLLIAKADIRMVTEELGGVNINPQHALSSALLLSKFPVPS